MERQILWLSTILVAVNMFLQNPLRAQTLSGPETETAPTGKFALKTNLLLISVAAPNLGIEWAPGRRFSLTANIAVIDWHLKNRYALQLNAAALEAKWWFRPDDTRPLAGWWCGVYVVGSSRYDVQWKSGWQGHSFVTAGLSLGRSFPMGERWRLEPSLGGGWFHTREVRRYRRTDEGVLVWQQTRRNLKRPALNASVNLVWLTGKKGKT